MFSVILKNNTITLFFESFRPPVYKVNTQIVYAVRQFLQRMLNRMHYRPKEWLFDISLEFGEIPVTMLRYVQSVDTWYNMCIVYSNTPI